MLSPEESIEKYNNDGHYRYLVDALTLFLINSNVTIADFRDIVELSIHRFIFLKALNE